MEEKEEKMEEEGIKKERKLREREGNGGKRRKCRKMKENWEKIEKKRILRKQKVENKGLEPRMSETQGDFLINQTEGEKINKKRK